MTYRLKIQCSCGRNLAFASRPDQDDDRRTVGAVVARPGVSWHEVPGPFVRPGGLAAAGWVASCPDCHSHHLIDARAVIDAVKAGEKSLVMVCRG